MLMMLRWTDQRGEARVYLYSVELLTNDMNVEVTPMMMLNWRYCCLFVHSKLCDMFHYYVNWYTCS